MKKIIVLLIMLMLVSVVHAGTVTRSVEPATIQPGDEVTVTLSVVALDEDLTYVIRENVPAGWEFVSASFQKKYNNEGYLAKIEVGNAQTETHTYKLKSPANLVAGDVFSGTYFFVAGEEYDENAELKIDTAGTTAIAVGVVDSGQDTPPDTTCLNIPALATLCPGATEDGTAAELGCSTPLVKPCEYKCNTGLTACGNTCVDKQVDNNNCGSCSNVCDAGKSCVKGQCQIPQKAMQDQSCDATADCETGLVCENGECTSTLSPFLQDMKEFEEDHPDQIADYEAKKEKKSFSAKFVSAIAKFFKDLFN